MQCIGFAPVSNLDARVLILGSLPGAESLKRQQYYAKKANSFWWIMGQLVGASPDLAYEERLNRLTESGIALWDVCAVAERKGSLDSNIRSATVVPNDFDAFLTTHPAVAAICFNGRYAEKLFLTAVLPTLPPTLSALHCALLPSTSPAHATMRQAEKLSRWRETLGAFINLNPATADLPVPR